MSNAPLEPQWYVARDGKRFGPISDAEFRQMATDGRLRELDYVWKQGFGDWVLAKNVPGLMNKPSATITSSSFDTLSIDTSRHDEEETESSLPESEDVASYGEEYDHMSQWTSGSSSESYSGHSDYSEKSTGYEAAPTSNMGGYETALSQGNYTPDSYRSPTPSPQDYSNMSYGEPRQSQPPRRTDFPDLGQYSVEQPAPSNYRPGQSSPEQFRQPQGQMGQARPGQYNPAAYQQNQRPQGVYPGSHQYSDPLTAGQPFQPERQIPQPGQPQFGADRGQHPSAADPYSPAVFRNAQQAHAPAQGQRPFAGERVTEPSLRTEGNAQNNYSDIQFGDPVYPGSDLSNFEVDPDTASRGRRGSTFRSFAYLVAIVLFLGVIAGVAIPFVVPAEAIRDQVVRLVKEKTGRDVIVRGRTSIAFFPSIGVKLNDITLANPPGMAGEPLLRMAALSVDLKLLPLITKRQLELERFVLNSPRLSMFVDQNGQKNWQFEQAGGAPTDLGENQDEPSASGFAALTHRLLPTSADPRQGETQLAQNSFSSGGTQSAGGDGILKDLSLGDVRIVDGAISYQDIRSGARQNVGDINLVLKMKTLSEPLNIAGTAAWKSETVTLTADIETPQALMNRGFSPLKISFKSFPLDADFRGQLTNSETPVVIGNLTGKASSLNALVHWVGVDQNFAAGSNSVELASDITVSGDQIRLEKTRLTHAGMSAEGNTDIMLADTKPFIRSTVKVDHLDLNKLLGVDGPPVPQSKNTPTADKGENPVPNQDEPKTLTELINSVNTKSEGDREDRSLNNGNFIATTATPTAVSGTDMTALMSANADISLEAEKVSYKKISLGSTNAIVNLRDGILAATLEKTQLYGGAAKADFTLDGTLPGGPFKSSITAENVSALPFLRDAANFDWISGRANITAEINGSGEKHEDIMQSLSGTGKIAFADGAIEGINIPGIVRNLQNGQLSGLSRTSNEKTDFSELTGTFIMDKGVAANSDLNLVSPLLRMEGAGKVDLGQESIDYQLRPKLVASLQGQGAKKDLSGLEIPVRIKGPWQNPEIMPDAEKLLKDPNAIVNGVKQIGKLLKSKTKIKGSDFESIIGNVLKPKSSDQGTALPTPKNAPTSNSDEKQLQAIETNKLLKQLLAQ